METTFSENQQVLYGEYIGTIQMVHTGELAGMADVRLDSGLVCVAIEGLKPLTPPQIRRLWRDGGDLIIESFDEREAIIAEMNTAKGSGRIPAQDSAIADRIVRSYNGLPDLLDEAVKAAADIEEYGIIFRNRGDTMRGADCKERVENLESIIALVRPKS